MKMDGNLKAAETFYVYMLDWDYKTFNTHLGGTTV